jgi:tRNA(fMet)-specific endonuclease VapC
MTLYVLDTDTLTLFQDGHEAVVRHALQVPVQSISTTVLSVEEQLSGWYSAVRRAKHREKLAWAYRRLATNVRFLSRLQVLEFTESAMDRYDQFRKLKLKIGRTDMRIAATVLEHGGTLVTGNVRDFQQIPGLAIEDWSS